MSASSLTVTKANATTEDEKIASNMFNTSLIFIAGDASQVGKSSVCLGLLGSLLDHHNFLPEEIAYIKPCTQCEKPQLISQYCEARGIDCVSIGPVVFYSGFTRSFLAGEQGTSTDLIQSAVKSVQDLMKSKNRKVVIVDGVGYPAVGSICGISNADVAAALKAPVLLVGKKGVGNAVDSFNLNACYFESRGVQVLGGIFNRLPANPQDYYSLEKCKNALNSYFQQFKPKQIPYGFIPHIEGLQLGEGEGQEGLTPEQSDLEIKNGIISRSKKLIDIFANAVDIKRLLFDMNIHTTSSATNEEKDRKDSEASSSSNSTSEHPTSLGTATTTSKSVKKSRDDIEIEALMEGAPSS